MAKLCPICGHVAKIRAADGIICAFCASLTPSYYNESVETIKGYWNENNLRGKTFTKTSTIKSFMSDQIVIDDTHKLFYIFKKKLLYPRYIFFNEVFKYEYHGIQGNMVMNSKDGLGNKISENTSFDKLAKPQKNRVPSEQLELTLFMPFGRQVIFMLNPPAGFITFLDKCIDDSQLQHQQHLLQQPQSSLSTADEILKFKKLLDEGIISQDEFDTKKKQLLNQ